MLVGLNVLDDAKYESYRHDMRPILNEYRGGFGYDFEVSKVLISKGDADINRVFTIYFGSQSLKDKFFTDPRYLEVKEKYFVGSVANTTIISAYETRPD